MNSVATPARAQLGIGRVRHQRLRPTPHGFDYPTWFLLLPLRTLRAHPDLFILSVLDKLRSNLAMTRYRIMEAQQVLV